ncbi:MAG: FAD-dependent oxidoreductase, partial [Myxococcota bacterium]
MSSPDTIDVLIVGGGPAGLSAALYLGRARRSVWVVDAGQPRHAVSEGVHNFLTRDGLPPAALREEAWAQMKPYTSVRAYSARVEGLEGPSDASQSWRAH